jgi:hypothetical protein
MGQKFEILPLEQQDKLKAGLLKTINGIYINANTAHYWIGSERITTALTQDKLK